MIIAIDPGMSGAISFIDREQCVAVQSMPDTIYDIKSMICDLQLDSDIRAVIIEKVGGYMPGNSGPAAVKFARHCGQLDGLVAGMQLPVEYITPTKWMKAVLLTVPKEKNDRKNAIKLKMQQLYPHLKVTLKTADALGILTYALEKGK